MGNSLPSAHWHREEEAFWELCRRLSVSLDVHERGKQGPMHHCILTIASAAILHAFACPGQQLSGERSTEPVMQQPTEQNPSATAKAVVTAHAVQKHRAVDSAQRQAFVQS